MKINKYLLYTLLLGGTMLVPSCSDSFLDQPPQGSYSAASLANLKGIEGLLIGAYSNLDGSWFQDWGNNHFNQHGGASNWVLGSIRGADAYKGTEPSDGVDINPIERHEVTPANGIIREKWVGCYDGIGRVNETMRVLAQATDLSDGDRARISGECRFLRGHYHFEAVKVFGNAPYVDETITDFPAVKNDHMIWSEIEDDFKYAYDNLPGTQTAPGRANKWAAASYLAKVYMYQGKWSDAKALFDQIVANGTTAAGAKYALNANYYENFASEKENGNTESIFAVENSAYDGSIANGNYENTLNVPHGSAARTSCCGFFQPSQFLVNSFKTVNGLPMLDNFNDVDVISDEGLSSDDPFTPDAGEFDPRLDHTVGRRGIQYLDWGPHPGNLWIRQVQNGGPYSPKKNVPSFAEFDNGLGGVIDWGFVSTSQNVQIIRYSDVLLLAAEAEAELGNTAKALEYVNMVRNRAANPESVVKFADGTPCANYSVQPYAAFASQAEAIKAVRFERMLELGMEGQRFFDLTRWDNLSKAGKTAVSFDAIAYLNAYLSHEQIKRIHLAGAVFTEKYKLLPIPESVITQSTVNGVRNIEQNPGF